MVSDMDILVSSHPIPSRPICIGKRGEMMLLFHELEMIGGNRGRDRDRDRRGRLPRYLDGDLDDE